jgi:hypothetical protein
METSVAFSVRQVSVVDCPRCTEFGFALMLAVGAGGGGGGGGGAAGCFFLHAVTSISPARARTRVHFTLRCFTSSSRCANAQMLQLFQLSLELPRIQPKCQACQQWRPAGITSRSNWASRWRCPWSAASAACRRQASSRSVFRRSAWTGTRCACRPAPTTDSRSRRNRA